MDITGEVKGRLAARRRKPKTGPLAGERGITLVFASLACMAALFLGASIVTAAYGNYRRSVYNTAEKRRELCAYSGAKLLRDGLEGASITMTTLTVYRDGSEYLPEERTGELDCGGGWKKEVLEGACSGGGALLMSAEADGAEISWGCAFSGFEMEPESAIKTGEPLRLSVTYSAEGADTSKTLLIGCSVLKSSRIEEETKEEDGALHTYTYEYKTYVYTLGGGEIG